MGNIVHCYKLCDNDEKCAAKKSCPRNELQEQEQAIVWDRELQCLRLIRKNCDECGRCTQVCGCFQIMNSEAEVIIEEDRIERLSVDRNFMKKDRFGAKLVNRSFLLCNLEEMKRQIEQSKALLIIEVVVSGSLTSHFDSVSIESLIGYENYHLCYQKIELCTEEILVLYRLINKNIEMPALLFFSDGQLVDFISGIYKSTQNQRIKYLTNQIQRILTHISTK